MLNKIHRVVIGIKLDIKENNYRLSKLEETVSMMKQPPINNTNNNTTHNWDFPIKSIEEFDLFENKLLDENFKSNIVSITW